MVEFDDTFRQHLRELFVWRRDVRRFRAAVDFLRAHNTSDGIERIGVGSERVRGRRVERGE